MNYEPKNYSAVFERLGSKFVGAALINGEFFGETKERAELWLKENKDERKINLTLWAIIATLFGSSFAAIVAIVVHFA